MTPQSVHPHTQHAHWPESAAALLALGFAKAFTLCQPSPSNQLTLLKDQPSSRPLPGDLSCAFGFPAIGSLSLNRTVDLAPRKTGVWAKKNPEIRALYVTEQSDFSGKNHSSAFAAQRTCSCACQARSRIHPAISQK
jgi:hypothetical protein